MLLPPCLTAVVADAPRAAGMWMHRQPRAAAMGMRRGESMRALPRRRWGLRARDHRGLKALGEWEIGRGRDRERHSERSRETEAEELGFGRV